MSNYGFRVKENSIKLELTNSDKEYLNGLGIKTGTSHYNSEGLTVNADSSSVYGSYDFVTWYDDFKGYTRLPLVFNRLEDEEFTNLILENKLDFIFAFVKNMALLKGSSYDKFDEYLILLYETKDYIYNTPHTTLINWYEHVMKKLYPENYVQPLTWDYVYFDRNVDFLVKFYGVDLNC